jgi:membrane-associated protease RseP (regulator of RpoE activity)
MLNMDMIGRLNEEKRLVIGGVGTSPAFVPVINGLKTDIGIKKDSAGMGPSDHASFYMKNIPVLFAFTGQHSDYHKPTDDTKKVNFSGEVKILNLMTQIINQLDHAPKLLFQETKTNESDAPRFKVTLGIMPDYTYEGKGVKVDGVTDSKPAAKAGVKKDDIIVGLGDFDVTDMQVYMKALAAHKKGDKTKVKVKRGEETKTLDLQF